jgi:outer membrane protein OmpA-like peptidoglycan-associated protein
MRIAKMLAVAMIVAAPALAAEEPSSLYFGGAVHYYAPDNDSISVDGAGGGVFVGLPTPLFAGRGSLEFGGFGIRFGRDGAVPGYTLSGAELVIRTLMSEQLHYSSFLIAGLGYRRTDQGSGDSGGFVTGGIGALIPLVSDGWYLRGDLRMLASRVDLPPGQTTGQDLQFDYRASLGLEYSFLDAAYARSSAAAPAPVPAAQTRLAAPRTTAAPVVPVAAPAVIDSDGDGVPDQADYCPGTARGTAVDPEGCPQQKVLQDSDGDGVMDDKDRCAGTPPGAAVDELGCALIMDADGDGIADARDECPDTPPGAPVDLRGCSLQAPDADRDGVADAADRCPGTPPGALVDERGCVRPAGDADGDGIPDDRDRCPATPTGTPVDARGCAVGAPTPLNFRSVVFAADSSALTDAAKRALDEVALKLNEQPLLHVEVAGHTDSTGSQVRNLELSKRRANAVRDYLVGRGVMAERLHVEGYGPFSPAASNGTAEGRALNHRVDFKLRR